MSGPCDSFQQVWLHKLDGVGSNSDDWLYVCARANVVQLITAIGTSPILFSLRSRLKPVQNALKLIK